MLAPIHGSLLRRNRAFVHSSNSHYDGGSRAGTGRRAGFSPASALCELPGKLFLLIAGLKFPFSVFLCEWTDNKSLRGGWSALKMSR